MSSEMRFKGIYLPLITPFKDDEKKSVDEETLRKLVNYYIENGIDGLVPCGTTGEAPTLNDDEHKRVIEVVVEETKKRVPVIAGAGSNNTPHAIELTKFAADIGADATLQASPYYNRPSQDGIFAHYKEIANATDLPIIIYNIPARTGRNIEPKTIVKLWKEVPTILGLKDACCDNSQLEQILMATRGAEKPFSVLAGEDINTYATLTLGGHGAISAICHVVAKEYREMCKLMLERKESEYHLKALDIHYKHMEIGKKLFLEPNPAPVKAALHMLGLIPS
ncbi:4-hydroxy-tetrahydrodipicolinate synthase, partial [Candidatus Micrarchaeota archaeon]|nr:4-hydroxy-tetrahydrodipicolinate synthase [Candidatus Micrarchaeota archaeon]